MRSTATRKHNLRAFVDMRLICVFNPLLTGQEVHNDEGYYPLPGTGE